MNIRTERMDKITDAQCLEIYEAILKRKRLCNVPYSVAIRSYGIISWSAIRDRAERIAEKLLDKGK